VHTDTTGTTQRSETQFFFSDSDHGFESDGLLETDFVCIGVAVGAIVQVVAFVSTVGVLSSSTSGFHAFILILNVHRISRCGRLR
jgi:hypothetical protein